MSVQSNNSFKSLLFIIMLFPLIAFSNTLNWGRTGHRTVGKIAEGHLTNKTKRHLKKLLNGGSLALYATYADEIKSDKRYNEFYTWHYINMPFEDTYESSTKNPKGDLVSGIDYCINIIKNESSTDEDKVFYLKLLVHLIGDLHQPMHIGLAEDRGGNDFKVSWFGNETNLHSVWDSKMIEDYNMSYSELASNSKSLSKNEVKSIQSGSVIDWVNQTHLLTKQVYKSVSKGDDLKYRYSYLNMDLVRTQLQKAGVRLAKVLNELF